MYLSNMSENSGVNKLRSTDDEHREGKRYSHSGCSSPQVAISLVSILVAIVAVGTDGYTGVDGRHTGMTLREQEKLRAKKQRASSLLFVLCESAHGLVSLLH